MRAAARRHAILLACLAVSACSTSEALDPRALFSGQPAAAPAQPAPPPGPLAPAATGPVASSRLRMEFAPVVGATVDAVTPLSRRLSLQAPQRGIEIVPGGAAPGEYLVKGYLSAIGDGGETIVIFVWDVLDTAGNRLHRIQGQERVAARAGADPWRSVPSATMEQIADRTIGEIVAWSTSRNG
ncbi:hypothetical protein [Aquibium microcysteis]|uniref:hypothetical protein n=1 Tax=Aquibium microcysteis TaxID=675281 RepID=UPI00165D143D|nr:hypothetical protein [Aquibium microcysteis]